MTVLEDFQFRMSRVQEAIDSVMLEECTVTECDVTKRSIWVIFKKKTVILSVKSGIYNQIVIEN